MKTLDELAKEHVWKEKNNAQVIEHIYGGHKICCDNYKAGYARGKADAIEAAVKTCQDYFKTEMNGLKILNAVVIESKLQNLKSDTPNSGGDISFPTEHGNGGDIVDLNKLMRKDKE